MFDLPSIQTASVAPSSGLSTTRKGTGAGGGATNMKDLLRHEGQEVFDRPALDTSHWKLPVRFRGEMHAAMQQKEGLRNGIKGLLEGDIRDTFVATGSNNPDVDVRRALKNVGDRSRKHFDEKPSDERPWKPGFKTTVPEILPARPRGKRPVDFDTMVGNDFISAPTAVAEGGSAFTDKPGGYRQRIANEELGDLPRGRKHTRANTNPSGNNINGARIFGGTGGAVQHAEPLNRNHQGGVEGEVILFKPKKVVVDPQTGVPRSWQGPPFFDTAIIEETQRREEKNRKQLLRDQLNADTLIGGLSTRIHQAKHNTISPTSTNAPSTIDCLGATGGSKVLAASLSGGQARRGDVTGFVLGGTARGGSGSKPDAYARKEARVAVAKDIADVKSLPSY